MAGFENAAHLQNEKRRGGKKEGTTTKNLQSFCVIHSQGLKISKLGENPAKFFFPNCKLNSLSLKYSCGGRAQEHSGYRHMSAVPKSEGPWMGSHKLLTGVCDNPQIGEP